jgi:hypothetical protein
MSTVVFLGPSLPHAEARRILAAEYRPPVSRGDLTRVVAAGARTIGIVDGQFGQALAITITEIKRALTSGVVIYGGGSMGALRAAECDRLGMRGVGWIYGEYAAGRLAADEEVALSYDPATLRSLTIPLVNIRWSALRAQRVGVLAADEISAVVERARAIPFWERSLRALAEAGSDGTEGGALARLVAHMRREPRACDRKRRDAVVLLERLRRLDRSKADAIVH